MLVLLLLFVPAIWLKAKKKKTGLWNFSLFLFVAVLLIGNLYTPVVTTVEDCGKFEQNLLIFPKDGYEMGSVHYIENKSAHSLLLAYVGYGDVSKIPEDILIGPNETRKIDDSNIDYLFEEPPESITLMLTCTIFEGALA
jgi:hypothetical protein